MPLQYFPSQCIIKMSNKQWWPGYYLTGLDMMWILIIIADGKYNWILHITLLLHQHIIILWINDKKHCLYWGMRHWFVYSIID